MPRDRPNPFVRLLQAASNPKLAVQLRLRPITENPIAAIQEMLSTAIDSDDDILTQHTEARQLKPAIQTATSFQAIVRVLRNARAIENADRLTRNIRPLGLRFSSLGHFCQADPGNFSRAPKQNVGRNGGSAIDRRTTRHEGYAISQRKRKRIEECFGWLKTIALMRKVRHRGIEKVGWIFTFAAAGYNLVRMRNLLACPVGAA